MPAVEGLQCGVDLAERGDDRFDPESGLDFDILDGDQIERICHGDAQPVAFERDGHAMAGSSELRRDPAQRIGVYLCFAEPDEGQAVLCGEDTRDQLFAGVAMFDGERAKTALRIGDLFVQDLHELLVRHDAEVDQDFAHAPLVALGVEGRDMLRPVRRGRRGGRGRGRRVGLLLRAKAFEFFESGGVAAADVLQFRRLGEGAVQARFEHACVVAFFGEQFLQFGGARRVPGVKPGAQLLQFLAQRGGLLPQFRLAGGGVGARFRHFAFECGDACVARGQFFAQGV